MASRICLNEFLFDICGEVEWCCSVRRVMGVQWLEDPGHMVSQEAGWSRTGLETELTMGKLLVCVQMNNVSYGPRRLGFVITRSCVVYCIPVLTMSSDLRMFPLLSPCSTSYTQNFCCLLSIHIALPWLSRALKSLFSTRRRLVLRWMVRSSAWDLEHSQLTGLIFIKSTNKNLS